MTVLSEKFERGIIWFADVRHNIAFFSSRGMNTIIHRKIEKTAKMTDQFGIQYSHVIVCKQYNIEKFAVSCRRLLPVNK